MCLRLRIPLIKNAGIYPTLSEIDEPSSLIKKTSCVSFKLSNL